MATASKNRSFFIFAPAPKRRPTVPMATEEAAQTGATRRERTRSSKAVARRWSLNLVVLGIAAPRVPPVGVFVSGLQADQPPVGGSGIDVAPG